MKNKLHSLLHRHPGLLALVTVELAVCLLLLLRAAGPMVEQTYLPADLISLGSGISMTADGDSARFADRDPELFGQVKDAANYLDAVPAFSTPPRPLPAGKYEVTLTYHSDTGPDTAGSLLFGTSKAPVVSELGSFSGKYTVFTDPVWLYTSTESANITVYANSPGLEISSITLRQCRSWQWGLLLTTAAGFLILDALLLLCLPGTRFRLPSRGRALLCVAVFTVLLASLPASQEYSLYAFDLQFHLSRISGVAEGLRQGQFPVRLYPDFLYDFGYASPLFYGDILLYFPALLVLLGFPLFKAYNILICVLHAAAYAIAFFSFRRVFRSDLPATLGAVLYTLAPYRLYNAYARAAFGEFSAMTFLPLLVLGFWALYAEDAPEEDHRRSWLYLMLGFTGVIQTHVITTEIAALFAAAVVLLCLRRALRPQNLALLLKGAGGTVLLNLWFLVPFLQSMQGDYKCTDSDVIFPMQQFRIPLGELLTLFPTDIEDTYVGVMFLLGLAVFVVACAAAEHPPAGLCRLGWLCAGLGVAGLYLISLFEWDRLELYTGSTLAHYLCAVQFPFRYLSPATLLLCVATVCGVALLRRSSGRQAAILCSGALVMVCLLVTAQSCAQYTIAVPGRCTFSTLSDMDNAMEHNGMEYLPTGFDTTRLDTPVVLADEGVTLREVSRQGSRFTVSARNDSGVDQLVDLPLTYYPCYRLTEQQAVGESSIICSPGKTVAVVLSAGYDGCFTVAFREPRLWRLCELVSAAFLLALLALPRLRKTGKK